MTKLEAKKDLNFLNDKKRESGENRWMKKMRNDMGGSLFIDLLMTYYKRCVFKILDPSFGISTID